MKYKFTKKFQKELRPMFEVRLDPEIILDKLADKHGFHDMEVLLISALGSLYNPKGDKA